MSEALIHPAAMPDLSVVLPGRTRRIVVGLGRTAVLILLCLTPLTALLSLGWLVRMMRRETVITLVRRASGIPRREALRQMAAQPGLASMVRAPGLVMDTGRTGGALWRMLGGLWLNIQEGAIALLASVALTLPFGLLWLGAWWGGWENSFNKGYEQAAIGPIVALAGILVALVVVRHLPMALAHQAATGRLSAVFEWRTIRNLTRSSGWRTIWLALLMALASLVVLGVRVLPLGMEAIVPGFAELDAAGVEGIAVLLGLGAAMAALFATYAVRVAAARHYARAVHRLSASGAIAFEWGEAILATDRHDTSAAKLPPRMSLFLTSLVAYALGFVAVASVFVAQFFNHSWVFWLTHPVSGLPWLP